jgi:hypothetical protein
VELRKLWTLHFNITYSIKLKRNTIKLVTAGNNALHNSDAVNFTPVYQEENRGFSFFIILFPCHLGMLRQILIANIIKCSEGWKECWGSSYLKLNVYLTQIHLAPTGKRNKAIKSRLLIGEWRIILDISSSYTWHWVALSKHSSSQFVSYHVLPTCIRGC